MYVLGMEAHCLRAVAIVLGPGLHSAGAHVPFRRKRQLHVEGAKVRKELGLRMELVAVPRAVPPHSHLWKPLSRHQEVALVAGARHHLRELRHKVNPELHAPIRRQRLG